MSATTIEDGRRRRVSGRESMHRFAISTMPRDRAATTLLLGGVAVVALVAGAAVVKGYGLILAGLILTVALTYAVVTSNTFMAGSLALAALLQPPIGDIGPFPEVRVAEVLVPLVLAVMLVRYLSKPPGQRAETRFLEGPARPVHIALAIYGIVIAANLVRTKYFLPQQSAGVNRAFYDYAVGLGTYATVYYALAVRRVDLDWLLQLVFRVSLVICVIGIGAVVLNLPLNFGNLRYSVYDYGSGAVRVGFLEVFGTAGLALVLLRRMRFRWPAGLLFAGAVVASGGRGALIGAVVAVILYLVLTRRGLVLLVGAAMVVLIPTVVPAVTQNAQVQRLSQVNSQELQTDGRTLIYDQSFKGFSSDPLFGTGLGVPITIFVQDHQIADFYESQLEVGGHATYMSLLKNFGLAGLLPFVGALLIMLWKLGRRARDDVPAAFFFILLTAQAVAITVGGNGSEPDLFFLLAGGAASLAVANARAPTPSRSRGRPMLPAPSGRLPAASAAGS
jgi:O-antigen ligase